MFKNLSNDGTFFILVIDTTGSYSSLINCNTAQRPTPNAKPTSKKKGAKLSKTAKQGNDPATYYCEQ